MDVFVVFVLKVQRVIKSQASRSFPSRCLIHRGAEPSSTESTACDCVYDTLPKL